MTTAADSAVWVYSSEMVQRPQYCIGDCPSASRAESWRRKEQRWAAHRSVACRRFRGLESVRLNPMSVSAAVLQSSSELSAESSRC